jgi:uncharacterized membrane protein YphA (DoxX/SURF4 family)
MRLDKYKDYAPVLVRYGVGIVFFLFGVDQILNPGNWSAWMPAWIGNLGVELDTIVVSLGIFNLAVGVLLLLGLFTRLAALLAGLHLIGVIYTLGWNDITIRDIGLLLASIAVLIYGRDKLCLDRKMRRV